MVSLGSDIVKCYIKKLVTDAETGETF